MNMSENIRTFWEQRSAKAGCLSFESIGNLEDDPKLLAGKVTKEREKVFSKISLSSDAKVLDLGAGCGQWSLLFAPLAAEVTAVEFIPAMLDLARKEATKRGINNVKFVLSTAQDFLPAEKYDLIFLSGLIMYLDDGQFARMLENMAGALADDGLVFVRDASSILDERFVINDKYSEKLKANYSAIYRTYAEYADMFARYGYTLHDSGDMFDETSPLNKYNETRLRYYIFGKS